MNEPVPTVSPMPEVLDVRALGIHFRMTPSAALRALKRGDFGAFFFVGKRRFVRRDSMLAAFEAREVTPAFRPGPIPVPEAPGWARDLLHRRKSGRGGPPSDSSTSPP